MEPIEKSEEEWKEELDPSAYSVLREGRTEAPFSGDYVSKKDDGVYKCRACGAVLFSSEAKFNSGTGWPSFTDPAIAENIGTRMDDSHGMNRVEVYCKQCESHLGHVFNDGPEEKGGKRYCINSVCLAFEDKSKEA